MRLGGDYSHEMRKLREISDRDIERLLSGEALGDADLDEVASHLRNLRAASARIPGDEVASRHVAALVDAARNPAYGAAPAGAAPFAPVFRPRRSLVYRTKVFVARVAAGAVALSGATAGLAYAGVDLPGQAAEKAFEQVLGVELPNQGEDASENGSESAGAVADRVQAVIDAWEAEKGCAFGQAVAAAARGDSSAAPAEDPCAAEAETEEEAATAEGGKATGEEKSSAGKATAEEKSSAGKATAEEKSSAGKATGEEKSSAGRATGEQNSGSGQSTAEEKSETGKATGEEKSSEGQSNRPEETGKP